MSLLKSDFYTDIEKSQLKRKLLLFCLIGGISTFLFYELMTQAYKGGNDSFLLRSLIGVLSIIGFVSTWIRGANRFEVIIFYFIQLSYLALYSYLLHINDWSVFHRWSYFAVGIIICSITISFASFVYISTFAVILPLILSFISPLNFIELFHFHSANIVMFIIIGITIHNHFQYKNEIKNLTKKIAADSQLTFLGKVAGGLAHEINNPLAIIKLIGQKLRRVQQVAPISMEEFQESLNKLDLMVIRISKLTYDLLKLSPTAYQDKSEEFHLAQFVDDVLNIYRERLQKANLRVEIQPILPEVQVIGDRSQIFQALLQVIENSLDACLEMNNPILKIENEVTPHLVKLKIIDNGHGIPPEIRDQIMTPFFTTKGLQKASGLGLSMAESIMRQNKGRLYFDPNISGTGFVFELLRGKNQVIG